MSAVTLLYVNTSEEFTDKFVNILTGTQKSGRFRTSINIRSSYPDNLGCLLPCLETNIKTVFIDEKSTEGTYDKVSPRFDIAFSTTVKTYINDFPTFNFASFLAASGGAIGLWLGLGVQQILDQLSLVCSAVLLNRRPGLGPSTTNAGSIRNN